VTTKPAVSLVAVAGRRRATLDLARRIEQEGFTGIYCPSPGDGLALCGALALVTREIPFGTSIAHIYTRHVFEWAQTAAVIHELSGGRFRFGVGVSHGPAHARLGLNPGKLLDDVRRFVTELKSYARQVGALRARGDRDDVRPLAGRRHAVRQRQGGPRRRRGLAGDGREDRHPRALLRARRPDGRLRGADHGFQVRCVADRGPPGGGQAGRRRQGEPSPSSPALRSSSGTLASSVR